MTAPPAARRLGPRPLALHLASALAAWTSSLSGLPLLRSGSLTWKPELASAARELSRSLGAVAPEAISGALDLEIRARADAFFRGVARYRAHPYRRRTPDLPVLWQEGTTRLVDYGPAGGAPVLVVPSLINRGYILDLAEDKSLLRFLAGAGLRPMLVEWANPGAVERGFTLSDYVVGRLEAAAMAAAAAARAPLAVIGYCMGGLLALALAERRPRMVSALALLATPWDFHAERAGQSRVVGKLAEPLGRSFAALGELPVEVLQTLFAALDPLLASRKFIRFSTLTPGSPEERDFVALEDWLNDGVPLALPVMRECLGGWYGENTPGQGRWQVAGRSVEPSRIEMPSLVVVPAQDRIVPPASAAALATRLPAAEVLTPALGHIGMMVAREAPGTVWRPLAEWLRSRAGASAGSQTRRGRLSKEA